MLSVIVAEGLHDARFVTGHTVGFDALAANVRDLGPDWAAAITGVPAARIAALARRYVTTRPAMILLGGSSMHKGGNGWQAARAVSCLPALAGHLGLPGGGLGPRHGAASHGQALQDITLPERRPPGDYVPNQMSRVTEALGEGRVRVLLLFGTNMLSSYADTERVADGLARADLVVSHDLFWNETARRFADVVSAGDVVARGAGVQEHEHAPIPHAEGARASRRGALGDVDPPGARPPARRRRLLPVGLRRGPARRDPRPSGDRPRDGGRPPRRGRHPRATDLARRSSDACLPDAVGQGRALLGARGGARAPPVAGARARGPVAVSARVSPGPHAHPVPRLLRPRAGPADARAPRPRAASLDRACPMPPGAASPTARRSACSTSAAHFSPRRR